MRVKATKEEWIAAIAWLLPQLVVKSALTDPDPNGYIDLIRENCERHDLPDGTKQVIEGIVLESEYILGSVPRVDSRQEP